jgi:phage terminase Nu1 subunit (DNA packaging protein)
LKAYDLSASTLAKLFNLTEQRIHQLAREGVIPREKGKYELVSAVQGYIKHLQDRASGGRIERADVHAERARLVRAQAEHREMETARLRGSLLPFDEVVTAWQQLVGAFRAKCLALSWKLAPQLAMMNEVREIQDHIDHGHREALEDLSRFELARGRPARDSGSGQAREAPAKAHVKPVGRRARRVIG